MIVLDDFRGALERGTGLPFACYAWQMTPDGDAWGTVNLAGQDGARWGDNRMAEQLLTGQVHLFSRTADTAGFNAVQHVLDGLRVVWRLSAVQYEQDTRLLHYTWVWTEGGLLS